MKKWKVKKNKNFNFKKENQDCIINNNQIILMMMIRKNNLFIMKKEKFKIFSLKFLNIFKKVKMNQIWYEFLFLKKEIFKINFYNL